MKRIVVLTTLNGAWNSPSLEFKGSTGMFTSVILSSFCLVPYSCVYRLLKSFSPWAHRSCPCFVTRQCHCSSSWVLGRRKLCFARASCVAVHCHQTAVSGLFGVLEIISGRIFGTTLWKDTLWDLRRILRRYRQERSDLGSCGARRPLCFQCVWTWRIQVRTKPCLRHTAGTRDIFDVSRIEPWRSTYLNSRCWWTSSDDSPFVAL